MTHKNSITIRLAILLGMTACIGSVDKTDNANQDSATQDTDNDQNPEPTNPDINGDGAVNILVLGTNASISGEAFSPDQIAVELSEILSADGGVSGAVNVVAEDIHSSKAVTIGLGGNGAEYTYTHHSHSLTQYYYWPEGQESRWQTLSGEGDFVWDYVVIGADPYIVSSLPGYHALGAHKIAAKAAAGGAMPLLMMLWPQGDSPDTVLDHVESVAERTAAGSPVAMEVVPAGRAWRALSAEKKDSASLHPTPNGAYLAAAAIYSHIVNQSAAASDYSYDDEIAEAAWGVSSDGGAAEDALFMSPFDGCGVDQDIISYNHTGSSSENGILGGLNWVFEQAEETLQNGGDSPITFNYGRANSNFEANKRYQVDPERFEFSFGFPMQDHGNTGNESMLYGLDRRDSGTLNDTDLGAAQFMVAEEELPHARTVPIRTLFAQMKEVIPDQSAYRDSWHMHRDLDKASGAFMYTLLTGKCALGEEPADTESADWRTWTAHKIGYETAWTVMNLEAAPACD